MLLKIFSSQWQGISLSLLRDRCNQTAISREASAGLTRKGNAIVVSMAFGMVLLLHQEAKEHSKVGIAIKFDLCNYSLPNEAIISNSRLAHSLKGLSSTVKSYRSTGREIGYDQGTFYFRHATRSH